MKHKIIDAFELIYTARGLYLSCGISLTKPVKPYDGTCHEIQECKAVKIGKHWYKLADTHLIDVRKS